MPFVKRKSDPSHCDRIMVLGEAMIELAGIETGKCRVGVAGDTFNAAVYLARAGLDVAYATSLGSDPASTMIHAAIADEQIDTRLVFRGDGAPGLYAISVDQAGERSFTYWRSNSVARRFFSIADLATVSRTLSECDLFYLSGITLSLFEPDELALLRNMIAAAREAGARVVFDTNYRPAGWQSPLHARTAIALLAPLVSLALPTYEDEAELFGDANAEATAQRWLAMGAREVVVKDGAKGAFVAGKGWIEPPKPIKPRDTTGAGDSFNAAYIAARCRGLEPVQAVQAGHALAAKVIMASGAILPRERKIRVWGRAQR